MIKSGISGMNRQIIKVYPNVANSIWHMNLIAIKIFKFFFFINFVNNLFIFLDLVKNHCDYLYADRATRCRKNHTQPGLLIH